MDSDDVKPTRGKTRSWIKQVSVSGYSNNIIRKLKIKDRMRFKEMFRMSVEDVEFVVKHMDDNCFFENMCKYLIDITGDAWWMKTIFKLIHNMKIMVDEPKKCWMKFCSETKFVHPTWFFLFSQILKVFKPIPTFHPTYDKIISMLDEMLDWFALG